ncbi:DUF397 domain-containing protein [Nocardia sp. NPDC051832]|uniref:DUF397 domain-containing protein n=1 Tax=Nocardia sp. NPDC051832 TaxID=3155673 RepID=UPI003437068E
MVGLRDSNDRGGAVLMFSPGAWDAPRSRRSECRRRSGVQCAGCRAHRWQPRWVCWTEVRRTEVEQGRF